MTFKEEIIKVMLDQAEIYTEEKINPYLYGEILSALYATCSFDALTTDQRDKLDKHYEYLCAWTRCK